MKRELGRPQCCDDDWGGSHYHCPACGQETSMYGHVGGKPPRRSCTDTELPDAYGDAMSTAGPYEPPGPPWWEPPG